MFSCLKYHPCSNHIIHIPVSNCHKVCNVNAENNKLFEHQIDFASMRCMCVCFYVFTLCGVKRYVGLQCLPRQAEMARKHLSFLVSGKSSYMKRKREKTKLCTESKCCESGLVGVCRLARVSKT